MEGLKNQARARRQTVELTVEKVNGGGILAQGQWHNYGRVFKGEKLSQEAVGSRVEITEAYSETEKKWFIVDLQPVEEDSHDEAAPQAEAEVQESPAKAETASGSDAPAEEPAASPEALKYAEDLALKAGISSQDLDAGCKLLFKKSFNAIPRRATSCLIEAYGGYKRSGGSQRPERR